MTVRMKRLVYKAPDVQEGIARRASRLKELQITWSLQSMDSKRILAGVIHIDYPFTERQVQICLNKTFASCTCEDFYFRSLRYKCVMPCKHILKVASALLR